jgi:hypothetical protein
MTQETESALRKALDAMDSMHKRIFAAGWLAVVGTLAAYWNFYHVLHAGQSPERLLTAAMTALTCLIAWTTFATVIVLVRMTKRILRAIDLALRSATVEPK